MVPQEAQKIRSKPGTDGKVMLQFREQTKLEALGKLQINYLITMLTLVLMIITICLCHKT